MKRMTKAEAMAQIHALNTNLPPQVEGERHLARYLEKIIVALEPLADHEPVGEVASKLLFEWTDLFTYQEHDDQNLRGLPKLMLAMGAHLFHTEWEEKFPSIKGIYCKGTSTITRLPKWPSNKTVNVNGEKGTPLENWGSTPYFFRAFLVPYFNQYEDARVFKVLAETENPRDIYTRYLTENGGDKEKLIRNIRKHNKVDDPLLISERLAFTQGKQTLLTHVLRIGKRTNILHSVDNATQHFDSFRDEFNDENDDDSDPFRISDKNLTPFINDREAHRATHSEPSKPPYTGREYGLLPFEKDSIFKAIITLIREEAWDQVEYLVDLGMPTEALTQHLRETTLAALNSTDPEERTAHITTIKQMIAVGANPYETLSDFTNYLATRNQNKQITNPLPDDIFQAVYSYSLNDTRRLSSKRWDASICKLLITALLSNATHPTRQALRAHYRQALEAENEPSFLAAIYCATQTNLYARFFGLAQTTFEGLFLSECDKSACIPDLFQAIQSLFGDAHVTKFKDALIKAIDALSPEAKLKLRTLIEAKKTCLAVDVLRTRQHKGTQKDTTHFTTLRSKLIPTAAHYLSYDSSDDEAEKVEDGFEPTDDENTAIRIFNDLTPALRKPVEFYLHLLNQRLDLASAIVRAGHFDVNETVNWIQQNISGVMINYAAGNIALKLWSDTQAPTPTTIEEKIRLTHFLIEHGLSIFSLLDAAQGLKALDENDTQRAFSDFVNHWCESGVLEEHFHNIPLNHLKPDGKYKRTALHQKELSTLIAGDRPLPITALLHLCLSSITEEAIKKHFMQPLTQGQQLGLTHLLKALATPKGSGLPSLQTKLAKQISDSPDLVATFKELKENKTTCALFMILKYQPTHYHPVFHKNGVHWVNPYAASPYTLFKQQHWPKPVPAEVQARDVMNKYAVVGVV